jgi:hypothetical protein
MSSITALRFSNYSTDINYRTWCSSRRMWCYVCVPGSELNVLQHGASKRPQRSDCFTQQYYFLSSPYICMNLARCAHTSTELNWSLVIHILILEIIFSGAFKELYFNYQTQNVARIVKMFNLVQNFLQERLKIQPLNLKNCRNLIVNLINKISVHS